MSNTFLYFGSFNPAHLGHVAIAEYAIEHGGADRVVLMVSPQNPLKDPAALMPELERFEMAEQAAAASRYPERIAASCIEFLLPKPSYTIDTLRYLEENHAEDGQRFSVLAGGDIAAELSKWKEWETILNNWPVYIYPRGSARQTDARLHVFAGAPELPFSSTEIRALLRKGEDHYRRNEFGQALNAFRAALRQSPWLGRASQYVGMIEEILAFRHTDLYNP